MFDLIVLGGGPAGYLAGERAAEGGLSVLVVEKREIGGVCLNEGCIPSKALLYSAKLLDGAAHGEKYGVKAEKLSLDHGYVVQRKRKVIDTLVGGIKAKLAKLGAKVVSGDGVLGCRTAEGFPVTVNGETCLGKQLLIATGSVPVVPPIPGLKEAVEAGFALTNREVLELDKVPGEFVVIGGGVIGLEMASYFCSAGSRVTVIEMLDHIAGNTDTEIGKILQKNYTAKGVNFLLSAKVVSVGKDSVTYEKEGKTETVRADKVLLSIGRRAFTQGFGLENLGVHTERGCIKTDESMRTNVAGVWAAGDVNGVSMLAHTAYREAEVAVNNILGRRDVMSYDAIPAVIYTNPEVGSVGLTLEAAKERGINAKAVKLTMKYSGRYVAENEGGDGIMKLIVDADRETVVGCHVLSNYASEFIVAAVMMIEKKMRLNDIKKFVFPHPTVCEILREAVFEYRQ